MIFGAKFFIMKSLVSPVWLSVLGAIFLLSYILEYFCKIDPLAMACTRSLVVGVLGCLSLLKNKHNVFWYVGIFGLCIALFYIETLIKSDLKWIMMLVRYFAIGFLLGVCILRKKLSLWIFAAMLIGVFVGVDFPGFSVEMKRFGDIFLRMIKTLVAPLLFATLVVGIAGHSDLKQVGRIGLKSILYFEIVTTFALFIGLAAINISKAGEGLPQLEITQEMKDRSADLMAQTEKPKDHLVDIFPIALSLVKNAGHKQTMLNWTESLAEVMFKFTDIVMYIAPLAVFGAIASTVSKSGADILINLMKLVGTLYIALIVFVLTVLLPIALIAKVPIRRFMRAVTEPLSLAFATASSEAALPKAMENMERFGVPKKIVGFVIPTGYSFNLDGTTLYLSMATVFVAQMTGIDLSIGQQIGICLTLMLTSKGVAGVRGASFVILTSTVSEYGLDVEKASVILGVDALMDMARTSVNVLGNCLASAVIARSEKELDLSKPYEDARVVEG
jgi:proton glutamate symport protein